MKKPLKRHISLQDISREHHHGLLLSWKIKEGIKRKVPLSKIQEYVKWSWLTYMERHFAFEEEYVFPILGKKHKLVKKALAGHRRLRRLIQNLNSDKRMRCLSLLEEELAAHIRFEERVLFPEIEQSARKFQLEKIQASHPKTLISDDEWEDKFWL